ncbi:MAG: DUF424 family protein [Conexivisphaerales archaeon]
MNSYRMRMMNFRGSVMVNLCDEEVLGKTLVEGSLKVEITNGYFGENRVNDEEALQLLRKSDIANLVGERIVSKAIDERLADPRAVRRIDGVPFLMIFKFST